MLRRRIEEMRFGSRSFGNKQSGLCRLEQDVDESDRFLNEVKYEVGLCGWQLLRTLPTSDCGWRGPLNTQPESLFPDRSRCQGAEPGGSVAGENCQDANNSKLPIVRTSTEMSMDTKQRSVVAACTLRSEAAKLPSCRTECGVRVGALGR